MVLEKNGVNLYLLTGLYKRETILNSQKVTKNDNSCVSSKSLILINLPISYEDYAIRVSIAEMRDTTVLASIRYDMIRLSHSCIVFDTICIASWCIKMAG